MEKARQHPAVIPRYFAAVLFLCVIAEALSAFAVLALAFASPTYMFVALNLFGVFVAVRATAILVYGFTTHVLFFRMQPVLWQKQPMKFGLVASFNFIAVVAGLFLTQLPVGQ